MGEAWAASAVSLNHACLKTLFTAIHSNISLAALTTAKPGDLGKRPLLMSNITCFLLIVRMPQRRKSISI